MQSADSQDLGPSTKLHKEATNYNKSMSHRGITYRLIPSASARSRQLACLASACRYVWNRFLGENQRFVAVHREYPKKHSRPRPSSFSLGRDSTHIRLSTPSLYELTFLDVRYILEHQADAWTKYFKWVRDRPKSKGTREDDSFTIAEKVKLASGDSSMQIKPKSVR